MEFFKKLAEILAEKQDVKIELKKVSEDLVGMVTIADRSYQMTGKPEDFDLSFMEEIVKPVKEDEAPGLKSTGIPNTKKKASTPKANKPAASKKAAPKPAPKSKVPSNHKSILDPDAKVNSGKKASNKKVDPLVEANVQEETAEQKLQLEQLQEAQRKERFDTLMTSGRAHMEDKEYKEASDVFQIAVDEYPDSETAKTELNDANKKRIDQIVADAIEDSQQKITVKDFQGAFDALEGIHALYGADNQYPELTDAFTNANKKLQAFNELNS